MKAEDASTLTRRFQVISIYITTARGASLLREYRAWLVFAELEDVTLLERGDFEQALVCVYSPLRHGMPPKVLRG